MPSRRQQILTAWSLRQSATVAIALILAVVISQGIGYGLVLHDIKLGSIFFWCSEFILLVVTLVLVRLFGQRATFEEQQKAKAEKEATGAPRQTSANRPVSAARQDGNNIIQGTDGKRSDDSDSAIRSAAATPEPSSSALAHSDRPTSPAGQYMPVDNPGKGSVELDNLYYAGGSAVRNSRLSSDASTSYSTESSKKGKERQTSHDDDQDRQTFYDEDKERQTSHNEDDIRQTPHDEDKERQTFLRRVMDVLGFRRLVLLDAAFQLALCWLVLTSILLAYNNSWWTTLHQIQYQVTYNSAPRLRTPGVMFLTSSQDPFQTNLENATDPPVCGFRDYYDQVSTDCPWNGTLLIEDPATCNCTSNIRHNNNVTAYTTTATGPLNMTYFLYHFAPPIQVTKPNLKTVYYVWPNLSKKQINVKPSEPLSRANCSRSQINVVFYDPESTDAKKENWDNILAADDNPMYPLPAGSVFNVQVQRNTFKNMTDQSPRTYFTASWGPPMQTGDCSVLFSVSYATMQQKDTVAVPVKGVSDYVGQLGGFLSLIQAVATILLWMGVLCLDLRRLRRHVVNADAATGA